VRDAVCAAAARCARVVHWKDGSYTTEQVMASSVWEIRQIQTLLKQALFASGSMEGRNEGEIQSLIKEALSSLDVAVIDVKID